MRITEITRRDIADSIVDQEINWSGRLEETEFLARLYDLEFLPSTDRRFDDARSDIWQHRIRNPDDWGDDWVFTDDRFGLMDCDDDRFLQFLCETIHPAVRPNADEAAKICDVYNEHLKRDGFELVVRTRVSGKPIYTGRDVRIVGGPSISAVRQALAADNMAYVAQQITRMETSVEKDPDLAIGTAKELIETCCKTILEDRGVDIPKMANLPRLVKLTSTELKLSPANIPNAARASNTIKRLLSNLAVITQGLAELRNQYGTGHGKVATSKGLSARHAKLAVGAASTLALFLVETHEERG